MQQESSPRSSQASVSAALAAANTALRDVRAGAHSMRPDSGRSLADMAQRDLDAALQLLADRAQYITGSSGAAIALRRSGGRDMLCRASSGASAPELGTLLSTEFGLSGESVRTRRALRCDDAERDARVNHEVCREVGIASVVVMPVVHDDEVLGVFELFSGKAHAFGERDMSALQRLSEMVETAVRLACAADKITERWIAESYAPHHLGEQKTSGEFSAGVAIQQGPAESLEAQDLLIDDSLVEVETEVSETVSAAPAEGANGRASATGDSGTETQMGDVAVELAKAVAAESVRGRADLSTSDLFTANLSSANLASATSTPGKRPLFWSAAPNLNGEAPQPAESDRSHVPAVFRNLRQCQACGFPVSSERALCVECEEKKWRGQLKTPRPTAVGTGSGAAAAPALDAQKLDIRPADIRKAEVPKQEAVPPAVLSGPAQMRPKEENIGSVIAGAKDVADKITVEPAARTQPPQTQRSTEVQNASAQQPAPALVFSAGLEPTQSWASRNKYVLGAILVVAATVAAIWLIR
jgi:hypothetical protein